MTENNFPKKVAIFPLSNAVFYPGTILPLNIFEKKYIQLINDSIREKRLFGMVQPNPKKNSALEVYKVGCLGKITSFNETVDKRFIINLSGIIRFRIIEELNTEKLYREFNVDYSDFLADLDIKDFESEKKNAKSLLSKIKLFFKMKNYLVEWTELEKLSFDQLINTVCMVSPFSVEEKQKLVETIKISDKIKLLEEIIQFYLLDNLENKTIQ